MLLTEGRVRRIIKEELQLEVNRRAIAVSAAWMADVQRRHRGRRLNEGLQGDIELRAINGRLIARMLRDSGETLLASLIMNSDRPGASEYIWDQILKRGKESQRSWRLDFHLRT
jgi:hypothetical protein